MVVRRLGFEVLGICLLLWASPAASESALDACLREQDLVRAARVLDPADPVVYARVVEDVHGHVSRAVEIVPGDRPLADVFARAGDEVTAEIDGLGAQTFMIGEAGSALPEDPCRSR